MRVKNYDRHQSTRIPHLFYAITSRSIPHTFPPRIPSYYVSTSTSSSLPRSSKSLPSRINVAPKTRPRYTPPPAPPRPFTQGRKISTFVVISSVFGFTLALYVSYMYTSHVQAVKNFEVQQTLGLKPELTQDEDVSSRFNDLGRDFDDEISQSERFLFMGRKRMRICREARGKVLEVSCGTGRNMTFYDLGESDEEGIESLTFNDQSKEMIDVARRKWADLVEHSQDRLQKKRWGPGKREPSWIVGDVALRGTIKRPPGGFDTIVQTMGICSVKESVTALRMMGELVRQPGEGKEGDEAKHDGGGKILLLEHGRGYYHWMNRHLDNAAAFHADHYGCWSNKDIGRIVKESGLKVESIRRYHLGTTWEIILRPAPQP